MHLTYILHKQKAYIVRVIYIYGGNNGKMADETQTKTFNEALGELLEQGDVIASQAKTFENYDFETTLDNEHSHIGRKIYNAFKALFPSLNAKKHRFDDITYREGRSGETIKVGRKFICGNYYTRELNTNEFFTLMKHNKLHTFLKVTEQPVANMTTGDPLSLTTIARRKKQKEDAWKTKVKLIKEFQKIASAYEHIDGDDNSENEKYKEIPINKEMYVALGWEGKINKIEIRSIKIYPNGRLEAVFTTKYVDRLNERDTFEDTAALRFGNDNKLADAVNVEVLKLVEKDVYAYHKAFVQHKKDAQKKNKIVLDKINKAFEHILVAKAI